MVERPTNIELIITIRDFLQTELAPTLTDQRLRFRTLIAANLLAILEREMSPAASREEAEKQRLAVLLELIAPSVDAQHASSRHERPLELALHQLCEAIRAGQCDDEPVRQALVDYLRWSVETRLAINNPDYLRRVRAELSGPAAP